MRSRARSHWAADTDALWIGNRGALMTAGTRSIVERRAKQAGIEGVHAHLFRHFFAHQYLANGGQETDPMRTVGWKSREMVARYAASTASVLRRLPLTGRPAVNKNSSWMHLARGFHNGRTTDWATVLDSWSRLLHISPGMAGRYLKG